MIFDEKDWKCSLCCPSDYDSDWGGNRWRKMDHKTICPECGKHFSYNSDSDSDKVSIHPFLLNRLVRREIKQKSLWYRLKKLFNII